MSGEELGGISHEVPNTFHYLQLGAVYEMVMSLKQDSKVAQVHGEFRDTRNAIEGGFGRNAYWGIQKWVA